MPDPIATHDLREWCSSLLTTLVNGCAARGAAICLTGQPDLSIGEVSDLVMRYAVAGGELRLGVDHPLSSAEQRWLELSATLLNHALLEQKQWAANEAQRQASRRMMEISEQEFARIILDIHDGPVQNMFAALSQLTLLQSQVASQLPDDKAITHGLTRIVGLLENSLGEIRNFIGTFRPPEFERRDLRAVIDGLIIQHEELTGNTVDLVVPAHFPSVPLPVKIAVYRIVQEALSNASRHAGVDHHYVHLSVEDSHLELEIADEGAGFDAEAALGAPERSDGHHIGLRGMRERVGLLGGTFTVVSHQGQGTRIRVRVPLQ